jgi:hypothetical protein
MCALGPQFRPLLAKVANWKITGSRYGRVELAAALVRQRAKRLLGA